MASSLHLDLKFLEAPGPLLLYVAESASCSNHDDERKNVDESSEMVQRCAIFAHRCRQCSRLACPPSQRGKSSSGRERAGKLFPLLSSGNLLRLDGVELVI